MKDGPLFNFENVECKYAPYPVGYIRGVMPADIYREMATSFPAKELFVYRPGLGKKYSLNERADKQAFSNFVNGSPLWRRVYDEVKSPRFMHDVVEALYRQNVDIGLRNRIAPVNHSLCAAWRRVADAFSCLKRGRVRRVPLKSRFEFSMLPADGGHIKPHTDAPSKLITLVVSMMPEGEWNPAFGGGTSMLRPKDERYTFNHVNKYLEFDQTEEIHTFPFDPNQCVVFVKTFNSYHAVHPMTGVGSPLMRKTLTINIETY